ncbi:MAG: HAD family hydrolase [Nitrospiraceae bacterium]|nr:MAG: HAD family hydrolase [Nitrospiraceae bacterium]
MHDDEHSISIDELYKRVGSSALGLSAQEVKARQEKYGLNVLEEKKQAPEIIKFGRHLVDFFGVLLWTGSFLAFFSEYLAPGEGNLYIGIALAVVVVLNAIFTYIQEYQSEKIMESFKKMMPVRVEALRDGKKQEVLAGELVPGDIIFLQEGGKIPADARLTGQNALKVDHSSLTGESEPQLRSLDCTHHNILESRNMVFSGTLVQSGNGTAVVYGTGMNTQIGKIVLMTEKTESVLSPLRKELNHFIRIISAIAITLGISFFIIGFLTGNHLMSSLIFAIGILVANVPEGLLPTVTLCLSMTSKRMARKMALIKNLDSVETLGSTTVICTDKTGTITENRMSVNTIFMNMDERNVHEKGIGQLPGFDKLLDIAVLCNNARLDDKGQYIGDPTEGALLLFAKDYADISSLQLANERIEEHPFDSKTKRMITVNRSAGMTSGYLKGAPEVVLAKCSMVIVQGREIPMTDVHKSGIMLHYERLASRGERILGLAYRNGHDISETGFVFVALAGMVDPPRREIPDAISKCRSAGIKVVMITGDYSITAEAVARKVKMLDAGKANILTGEELDRTDDARLKEFLGKGNIIIARAAPAHKLRAVTALQEIGEVVTVTGDGVNDAPALKNADMGVAMGIAGTDVAKEAADMVLLDDNFATIVNAVEEGRTVYANIRKFIAYVLTSNVPEILPFIAFVLFDIPLPLTVVLILSIDLGTDLLPALGLGVESAEFDVMSQPPRPRNERLLSPNLLFMSYGIIGMLQAAAGFFSYFVVLTMGGWTWGQHLATSDPVYLKAVTAFFASIIICQIADVFICRTRRDSAFTKGVFSNRFVLFGIASELLLLANIVYNPYTHKIFGTHPLTLFELSLSIPFALTIFFGDELRKLLIRRNVVFVDRYLNW